MRGTHITLNTLIYVSTKPDMAALQVDIGANAHIANLHTCSSGSSQYSACSLHVEQRKAASNISLPHYHTKAAINKTYLMLVEPLMQTCLAIYATSFHNYTHGACIFLWLQSLKQQCKINQIHIQTRDSNSLYRTFLSIKNYSL